MTSLREQWLEKTGGKEGINNDFLLKQAATLKNDIAEYIQKSSRSPGHYEPFVFLKLPERPDTRDELKNTEGYKKIHSVCSDPDVDMRVELSLLPVRAFSF